LLGGTVRGVTIRRVDYVNDTTSVEVRFEVPAHATVVGKNEQQRVAPVASAALHR
jgi:hypothetical protein